MNAEKVGEYLRDITETVIAFAQDYYAQAGRQKVLIEAGILLFVIIVISFTCGGNDEPEVKPFTAVILNNASEIAADFTISIPEHDRWAEYVQRAGDSVLPLEHPLVKAHLKGIPISISEFDDAFLDGKTRYERERYNTSLEALGPVISFNEKVVDMWGTPGDSTTCTVRMIEGSFLSRTFYLHEMPCKFKKGDRLRGHGNWSPGSIGNQFKLYAVHLEGEKP